MSGAMGECLIIRRDAATTELRLNRPTKANALSGALVERLLDAVEQAGGDGTRLLVLRGEGANFCAGFDFSAVEQSTDGDLLHRFVRMELLLQALHHAPFATLALCHGGTYGAGADLVCVCDRRIAAPGTVFRMPGLRFGIALGTRRLAQRIGADAARDILGSSRTFAADEAERLAFTTATAAQDRWDTIIADTNRAVRLEPGALATLKGLVQPDTRCADLAALARSASIPGLKDRIKAFRATRE
jgi:enoyl-CoA hydratase/carnithine racemase